MVTVMGQCGPPEGFKGGHVFNWRVQKGSKWTVPNPKVNGPEGSNWRS